MAKDDVNIKVSSNVAEAIRMWQAMEEGPKGMAAELAKTGKAGRRANDDMTHGLDGLIGKWATVATGISLARTALEFYLTAQRESLKLTKEATVPVDELSRQFQIQGSLSNAEAQVARQRILSAAQKRGIDPEGGFGSARQLVSSGFAPEEVTEGGALDEFLKLLNATNASRPDVDQAELAKAMVQFLTATKQPKTAAAIRQNALAIQGLYTGTNLQAADLGQFAKRAAAITQLSGLKDQQLPILSQLLDLTDVSNAGTSFQAAVKGLATAGADRSKTAALKSIGLRPEDVDFVGEDFFQVQKTVSEALAKVPKNIQNIFAKRVFGDEGLLAGGALFSLEGAAETQRRLRQGATPEEYERARAITEGSLAAKERASKSGAAQSFFDSKFVDPVTARANLLTQLRKEGYGNLSVGLAAAAYDFNADYLGQDAESSVSNAVDFVVGGFGKKRRRIRESVIEQSRSTQPQDIKVTVELQDQNAVAIPHRSAVHQLSR